MSGAAGSANLGRMTSTIPPPVAALTPAQRAVLTGGDGMWHAAGVPEAGIGRLKVSDGPVGVRGERTTGTTSTSFPCGSALGATFDRELLRRVGVALGEEATAKGAHILLGPTVNLHRHPLAGRNFECYSEDPVLTAELAVAYIEGVQSTGVGACIKHFVANEQETERRSVSAEVDERTLRELQLVPFEAAVHRARVAAVMSAYNKVNGVACSEDRWLLTELLRDEWGFDGIVMSDWFGTYSRASIGAGLDLEMPGPPTYLGGRLAEAVTAGEVEPSAIDRAAERMLRVRAHLGVGPGPEPAERAESDPAHEILAREVAARSIVVLANDGLLPLAASALRRVAVIGPNAETPALQGGGSARVNPLHTVTPLQALVERLTDTIDVVHEPGCDAHDGTTVLDGRWLDPGAEAPGGRTEGLLLEFSVDADGAPKVIHREVAARPSALWFHAPADGVPVSGWRCTGTATFRSPRSGRWQFGLTSIGPAQLLLDGEVVVDSTDAPRGGSFYGMGGHEVVGEIDLDAGAEYALLLRYDAPQGSPASAVAVTAKAPLPADAFERAVASARSADVAIVVVGSTTESETEGTDRTSLELPGRQAELVEAVCAANPRTVVVLNAGAPVTTGWAANAGALVLAWLPGQEGGHAVADVLFGHAEPSGRLPVSFPVRIEDTAAYGSFPGADGKVPYTEGVLMGYRHHDTNDVEPAFCFGHGLSYTTFAYGEATVVDGADGRPAVALTLTNTGDRSGVEVVQVYARATDRPPPVPDKELVGFESVALAAGEQRDVQLALDTKAWTYWAPSARAWEVDAGPVELLVGSSSRDIRATAVLDPARGPNR